MRKQTRIVNRGRRNEKIDFKIGTAILMSKVFILGKISVWNK